MTKLTDILQNLRKCRKTHPNWRNYPVYRPLLPAVLKDSVRGRNEKKGDGCVPQLMVVMACWKEHEFESGPCQKEIREFQECYKKMEVDMKKHAALAAKGLIQDEDTNLSRQQVNTLLHRFPQIRPKDPYKVDPTFKKHR